MNFTLTAIDAAIGMIFIYLLMSSICSVLQEFIANLTSWRGRHLRNSIQAMLSDPAMPDLAQNLYRHPRISTLAFAGKLPSYIPNAAFAAALVDVIAKGGTLPAVATGPLAPFIRDCAGDVDRLNAQLAKWFDDAMDGFGGWYKRNVQVVIFCLALGLAAILNVNSLAIARALWTQPALRDAVVQAAGNFNGQNNANNGAAAPGQIAVLQNELDSLPLPVGWNTASLACMFGKSADTWAPPATVEPADVPDCASAQGRAAAAKAGINLSWEWLALAAGWVVTAFATSLGTQFWFQTLGEALQLRAAGVKPANNGKAAA